MHTSHKTQNATILGNAIKAASFFSIVLGLFILPPRAAGQNGVAVIGPTPTSTPYACTSAGIQQAISDAINHTNSITQSVVDASNCTSMSATYFTSEIDVGTGSASTLNTRIKLILPTNGKWSVGSNISDGTSYALKWGDGAMIYGGTGSGEGQPFSIEAGSGANLGAVCGNDPTYGQYYHAEGFTCSAVGGQVQHAVLLINGGYDESYVGHVTATNWGATSSSFSRVVWIHAACCSATFEDINAEAGNITGTVPCVLGDLNQGVHISKISCVHPGSGQNALQVYQSGGGTTDNGIASSYKDIYVELGNSSDTSTPYVQVQHLTGTWAAADLLDGLRAGIDVTGSNRCMVDIKSGRVNTANLSLGDVSTCAIKDEVNNLTINGAANSVIASYDMTPRYGLTLGALTVDTLPSAASNPGAMFRVTDSIGISSEGQNCRGGGGTIALAFSNGSAWKCF